MEEIKQFYGKSFQEYRVSNEDLLSAGLVCVNLHSDGYWYRAVVASFQDWTTVEVFFIDYGNVFKVKKSSLAYLHRRFGKLPGQAFEARLNGIKPAGERRDFTKKTTQRFLELTDVFTEDTEYLGLVAVVRGLGETLSLSVVDTCTNDLPQGIVINQVLVDEGLAVPDACSTNHVINKVNSWLDQMMNLNLGPDNSIDCELTGQTSLSEERDSVQSQVLHPVKMGGLDCQIVVKDGSAWMTRREVSRFIPNWKGKNLLLRMLRLKRIDISSLTVTVVSDPTFHASLKGAWKDENCEEIILYPLKSIPHILDLFLQVPGTLLRLALRHQIENFDKSENLLTLRLKLCLKKNDKKSSKQLVSNKVLEKGGIYDSDESNEYGETALYKACRRKNNQAVSLLLAKPGINVNVKNSYYGRTPFYVTCENNNDWIVDQLLRCPGIHENAKNNNGSTLIMMAALGCSKEALGVMFKSLRVDLDVKDNGGRGLEEYVGILGGSEEGKTKCLDMIREERIRRKTLAK